MTDDKCLHRSITCGLTFDLGEPVWACQFCGERFVPAKDMVSTDELARQADIYNTALDGIAGTMSAVLWDYSQRMFEQHGLGSNKDLLPEDQEPPPSKEECGLTIPHDFDSQGTCQNCGHSPFLGMGDNK